MSEYFLATDLGGTNLRVALIEKTNNNFSIKKIRKTKLISTLPSDVLKELDKLIKSITTPQIKISAIGIALAGMIENKTEIVLNAPNLKWKNFDFKSLVEEYFQIPCTILNDVNAILWGEYKFGAAKQYDSALGVFLGTGIGAAFIYNGILLKGSNGVATELGHVKISDFTDKPWLCGCGQTGCIEAYLGGGNTNKNIKPFILKNFPTSKLHTIHNLHSGHIDLAYDSEDSASKYLWNNIGREFGKILANAVTLLDPDVLMIGGTVWENTPNLRNIVLKNYEKYVNSPSYAKIINPFFQNDEAGILGAAFNAETLLKH